MKIPGLLWHWWQTNYLDVLRLLGAVGFVYGFAIDKGRTPALLPAALGLVLLKNVVNGKGGGG